MEMQENQMPKVLLDFDEVFEDGIFVDGSEMSLAEIDELMGQYKH